MTDMGNLNNDRGFVVELDESELVKIWEDMPWQVQEIYAPISCVKKCDDKAVYMAENRLDSSRVVVVAATGEARESLRTESMVMDLLFLNCLPKKELFCEETDRTLLVREYIKGESLGGAAARLGAFSDEEVRTFGEDLCNLFNELYDRSLTVDPATITARNMIIADGHIKFVEPEGIVYCKKSSFYWNETQFAIGELMQMLITGDGVDPAAGSKSLRAVIDKCMARPGKNYETVDKLLEGFKSAAPQQLARAFGKNGIVAVVAVLVLAIAGISLSRIIGQKNKNADAAVGSAPEIYLEDEGVPASEPAEDITEEPTPGAKDEE